MRSKWKLPFINYLNFQKVKTKKEKKLNFLSKYRNSTIIPKMVNSKIKVYNGIKFVLLQIKDNHVGYKLGNFTITKKRCVFKKKMKKKLKNKKK